MSGYISRTSWTGPPRLDSRHTFLRRSGAILSDKGDSSGV